MNDRIGIVVIGRNEAPRLAMCLRSIKDRLDRTVYVDSGSSDGSADIAAEAGAAVVRLTSGPFTAARGRRSGIEHLCDRFPDTTLIQFIDGDCELDPGWLDAGQRYLTANPRTAVVVGRLREKHPGRSILVRLTDMEWELPTGDIDVIGGISLMRLDALRAVGGWRDGLVAGEELDLSTRLRDTGRTLHRLADPMCVHDIGITRFREFWRRSLRAGYGYCNLSLIHRKSGPRRWRRRTVGSLVYGIALPLLIIVGTVIAWPVALAALILYMTLPIRLMVSRLLRGDGFSLAAAHAVVTTVCKSAMAIGTLRCILERCVGRKSALIEYKQPPMAEPLIATDH